jgi:RHS repeat-associated protein
MAAVTAPYTGKTIFQDSAVKISVDDILHIWAQKAILLRKAIIIDLFKGLKMILNTSIILGRLWVSLLINRRNIRHVRASFLKQNNQYYFYHNDHHGTPKKITSVNGRIVWSETAPSFGETDVRVDTVVNNLRFPGQYYERESGLHYNYHRYYDPSTGRYIRPDPMEKGPNC